jgi:hypothetical protein
LAEKYRDELRTLRKNLEKTVGISQKFDHKVFESHIRFIQFQ